jgi:transcriptional regulator with XRE-family HTH domain
MKITADTAEKAVLATLGERLARYRLNRNLTQAELAAEAGVSLPTVVRMEAGSSTQLSRFLRVLRALQLLENLEALIPEPPLSPLQQLKLQGRQRRRAAGGKQPAAPASAWNWADD